MSKITICEGDILWTSKKDTIFHTFGGDMVFNAGHRNIWHGEKGIEIGEYKEMESLKDFPYGWWSYDYEGEEFIRGDSNHNYKANLEEVVYFQLKVDNDIPTGIEITFYLYNRETFFGIDILNPDSNDFNESKIIKTGIVREVGTDKRITIELYLDISWKQKMKEENSGYLDLYWQWNYNMKKWYCEQKLHLAVYSSKRTLYLKSVYVGYKFPEIRSYDGNVIVFSSGIGVEKERFSPKIERILTEIKDVTKDKIIDKLGEYSDELRHTIAVRQLKKGKLVNNLGGSEFSKRIYTQPIFDNEGKEYVVTKAANFGYRKNGKLVTTKGVSQIDYFREVGTLNKVLKVSKNVLKIFDFIDLAKYLAGEKPETIPMPFVPLDFIAKLVAPQINEQIKEIWDSVIDEMVEIAKDEGIEAIKKLKYTRGGMIKGYDTTEIDQESLNKLFRNEIKTLDDLKSLNNNYNHKHYVLLHYNEANTDLDEIYDIVSCIFIK